MQCPYCKYDDTQVIDSRASDDKKVIRRRRRCPKCGARFTTYEKVSLRMPLIIKKDGKSRVSYNQDKLFKSMQLALRKRPVAADQIERAVDHIEERIRLSGEKEIPTRRIGEMVLEELLKLDKVAYIRFASVYLNYQKPEDFLEGLRVILKPTEEAGK